MQRARCPAAARASDPPEVFLLSLNPLTVVTGRSTLAEMFEAQATEFPFMAELPKREKSRVGKALEAMREMSELQKRVGALVPAALAAKILNVSRQRFYQLVDAGTLKTVQFHGHHYITESDLVEFANSDRTPGRRKTAPTFRECMEMAREWAKEQRSPEGAK